MKKLSIIIPAYNEERFIGKLLEQVQAVDTEKLGYSKEIIVVDDGSKDKTAEIASCVLGVSVLRQKNQGKGTAVRTGVKHASGDFILIQDADLEYDPNDYIPMLAALEDRSDVVVYGSRIKGVLRELGWRWPFPGRHLDQGVGPWLANLLLSASTAIFFGRWISDMLTGYKLYPADIIKKYELKTTGFETDHEISAKLFKQGIRIIEVSARYSPRTSDEGKKIRARDGLIAFWTLLRFRFSS